MLDWLRLIRASGFATIAANIAAVTFTAFYANDGFSLSWLAAHLWRSGWTALWVPLAGFLLYATGMVWNDLCDLDRDRVINPRRPLPSGRIGLVPAYVAGLLLAVGAVLAAAQVRHGLPAAGVVLMLALLYDLGAKQVPWLGSAVMALVRVAHACFALLLLGPDYLRMALTPWETPPGAPVALLYPLMLGVYVGGLSLMAELESRRGRTWELLVGMALVLGVVALALVRLFTAPWLVPMVRSGAGGMTMAVAALGLGVALAGWLIWSIAQPAWQAARSGRRDAVRPAVVAALGGMILFDAVAAGHAHPAAILLIALLYPLFRGMARAVRMD
jgi:4-hydroxybenzoate polyprenyltransferase